MNGQSGNSSHPGTSGGWSQPVPIPSFNEPNILPNGQPTWPPYGVSGLAVTNNGDIFRLTSASPYVYNELITPDPNTLPGFTNPVNASSINGYRGLVPVGHSYYPAVQSVSDPGPSKLPAGLPAVTSGNSPGLPDFEHEGSNGEIPGYPFTTPAHASKSLFPGLDFGACKPNGLAGPGPSNLPAGLPAVTSGSSPGLPDFGHEGSSGEIPGYSFTTPAHASNSLFPGLDFGACKPNGFAGNCTVCKKNDCECYLPQFRPSHCFSSYRESSTNPCRLQPDVRSQDYSSPGSSSSSSAAIPSGAPRRRKFRVPRCVFCHRNGEEDCEHELKNASGDVVCPVLSAYVCKLCGATGRLAHTLKYCPMNPYTKGDPVAAGMRPGLAPPDWNPLPRDTLENKDGNH